MRHHGFARITGALADHDGADKTGDARVDVHHRAAGEIERPPLVEHAGVGGHFVEFGLRGGLGGGVSRCGDGLGGGCDRVRAGPVPNHVGDREIDYRHPEQNEQHNGRETNALGEGADDQGRGDAGESHLERHIDVFGDDDAVREGRGRGIHVDALQERLVEPADEGVERAAVGEGERVAVEHPQHRHERHDHEDLSEDRQHVLRADEAAVEQRQPRDGHHQHQGGGDEHPGGVALIGNRRGGGLLGASKPDARDDPGQTETDRLWRGPEREIDHS